jgi:Spy/CpxP family protein refolding chaperone
MLRLLALSLLAAAGLTAQPRGFFNWWDRPLVKDLNLRPAQMREIRTTVRDYRVKLVDARAGLARAEQELQEVFDADTLDLKRAEAAVENLVRAREVLTRDLAQMSLRLRQVLTTEQWKELQRRRDEIESRRR